MENTEKQIQRYKRVFLGKTESFESREERAREKAHLKAYLKGKKWFRYGSIVNAVGITEPSTFLVRYDFEKIPMELVKSRASIRFMTNNPYMVYVPS